MMRAALVLALASVAAGFSMQQPVVRRPALAVRQSAPVMGWNPFGKKPALADEINKKKGGTVYDDEVDTRGLKQWDPDVAENGEVDLAAIGQEYYVAFIPFLLFCFAYSNGVFSFGYENGNF